MKSIFSFLSKMRTLNAVAFSIICAVVIVLFYNNGFWGVFFKNVNMSTLKSEAFLADTFFVLVLWISLLFYLIAIKYIFKPLTITLFLIAAIVSYFTGAYGVIIDKSMIRNSMETNFSEASELISPSLLIHLFFYGLAPSVIIAFTQPRYEAVGREALKRGAAVLIALLMITVSFFLFNKEFTFLFRQHPELRSLMNPTSPVYTFAKYMKKDSGNAQIQPVGLDARQTHAGSVRVKRTLLVIVVGETARAENFALNGYGRDTNPQLGKADIIDFSNTYSCGTDTAYSVPCMFSHLSRKDYTPSKAAQYETLLDVLTHAGVDVLWLDNNSGCKGVCNGVKNESVAHVKHPKLCNTEECYDDILLYKLKDRIGKASSDLVVILHQKGSHGPAYYKRIPDEYRKFTPECRSVNLQDCTTSEIVNSYDNTILYTDHFLYSVIGFLKGNATRFDTAMIYMSDHGESLGENGLYLHGFPYALAPDTQIHIPFISWISKEYADDFGIDKNCLMKDRERRYSHENLFHSVLGLLEVNSETYNPELDVFSVCKKDITR